MSPEPTTAAESIRAASVLTLEEQEILGHTILARDRLEEQYENLEQQHQTAVSGMWIFLATEVMFFGTLFLALSVYRFQYPVAFEAASVKLNWRIGAVNTGILLVSSALAALAVHYAKLGERRPLVNCLSWTAVLGGCFLMFKALEYYLDYRDFLIPGWRFRPEEWTNDAGLPRDAVPHVQLFLMFYWIMTVFHGLHVVIGIGAFLIVMLLARRGHFSPTYYTPVDAVALYWHFVDLVWIFLLPMLYLLGTHGATPGGL